jgi:peptidoglycan/LPS O-acetylase OafA/YrhL
MNRIMQIASKYRRVIIASTGLLALLLFYIFLLSFNNYIISVSDLNFYDDGLTFVGARYSDGLVSLSSVDGKNVSIVQRPCTGLKNTTLKISLKIRIAGRANGPEVKDEPIIVDVYGAHFDELANKRFINTNDLVDSFKEKYIEIKLQNDVPRETLIRVFTLSKSLVEISDIRITREEYGRLVKLSPRHVFLAIFVYLSFFSFWSLYRRSKRSAHGDSSGIYFPKLDGLRFVAFLLVFIHHSPPVSNASSLLARVVAPLSGRGWAGVELFFILSSFLLTRLLVEETRKYNEANVPKYFIRRILRIWPLYFFYIGINLFLLQRSSTETSNVFSARLIGLATFSDNLWSAISGYNVALPYVAHLWTISLEEQFYLLLPFIVPFLCKKSTKVKLIFGLSLLTILASFRITAVLLNLQHPFIWVLPIQCDAFIIGAMIGMGVFDKVLARIIPSIKLLGGLASLACIYLIGNVYVVGYNQVILYTIIAIGFALIMDGIQSSKNMVIDFIFGNPLSKYLGRVTYGCYVYHVLVTVNTSGIIHKIPIIKNLHGSKLWIAQEAITLLGVVLVSTISYELYERHFLKLKQKVSVIQSRPI